MEIKVTYNAGRRREHKGIKEEKRNKREKKKKKRMEKFVARS